MHPIERLRYVARASGAEQAGLVAETARALSSFHDDPAGMVSACRRVIDRHPTTAGLWWLCARMLTSPDPAREGWAAADAIADDRTAVELAHALPDDSTVCVLGWPEVASRGLVRRGDVEVLVVDALGEGTGLVRALGREGVDAVDVAVSGLAAAVAEADLLLLDAVAVGPTHFLDVSGALSAAAVAKIVDTPIWLTAGVGRLLPARMWDALAGRHDASAGDPWERDEEVVPLALVDRVATPRGLVSVGEALQTVDCPIAPELFGGGSAPGTFRG